MSSKTTLQKFLESGTDSGNFISLAMVKKITSEKYIVGDASCLGLLEIKKNGKEMKIGTGIKLVKPIRINEYTLQCNPHFSPVKTLEFDNIAPKNKEIQVIEGKVEISTDDEAKDNNLNFEKIRKMPPKTTIQNVSFLVINASRIIQTKSGQYQICGIKDIDSNKISINLYDKFISKLEVGSIITAKKISNFLLKKEGEYIARLQTTKFSILSEASPKTKLAFKNVKLADNSVSGIILGFTNISCYFSCAKHWNKIDEDEMCPVCGGKPQETKFDFKAEVLVENEEEKDNVKAFLLFKRAAAMVTTESNEDEVEATLAKYEGKKCTVEHDDTDEDDKIVIAKRLVTCE